MTISLSKLTFLVLFELQHRFPKLIHCGIVIVLGEHLVKPIFKARGFLNFNFGLLEKAGN